MKRYFKYGLIILTVPSTIYVGGAINYLSKCGKPRLSCLEHRKAGCNISGDYEITLAAIAPSAVVPTPATSATVTCDMDSDKGGWTLVGNYLHQKSSAGGPVVLPSGIFPLQKQNVLGLNETGTKAWGHTSIATLNQVNFAEVRFRCQTTAHQRLIDFAISSSTCLKYIRTGLGSCFGTADLKSELVSGTRSLAGNGSKIPHIADKGWKDQGDYAMVNYPFFLDYKNHWAVGRLPGRFECDDYDSGDTASTWHQVWVR